MLVREQRRHDAHADPVENADRQAEPGDDQQDDRRQVQDPRAQEGAFDAETRRDRVQPLAPVDLNVEQAVEEVEAGDPGGDGRAEHP